MRSLLEWMVCMVAATPPDRSVAVMPMSHQ
jgi:hypothetical protein